MNCCQGIIEMITGFRKLYFFVLGLREQHKDDAHGKESATTQLKSESTSALCTKKSARSCSQL